MAWYRCILIFYDQQLFVVVGDLQFVSTTSIELQSQTTDLRPTKKVPAIVPTSHCFCDDFIISLFLLVIFFLPITSR